MKDFQRTPLPNFADTENTFRHLSTRELKRTAWLFNLMGKEWLTKLMSGLGVKAVKYRLPLAKWAVKNTIFPQFVGGESLQQSLPVIEKLATRNVTSILDFGAEAKNTREDFDNFTQQVLDAINFSARNDAAVAGVVKVTGLADDDMLASLNDDVPVIGGDLTPYADLRDTIDRLDAICKLASEKGVQIYIDAEESWMQSTIDALAAEMMERYNKDSVTVLHTYQLYRHDRLQLMKDSHARAREYGYLLGAKLVRGAYMVKENKRAKAENRPTPIQPSLQATHQDYNAAVQYCVENIKTIGFCVGSHNEESNLLACKLLAERGLQSNHPHAQFAQLYGMSDNLTFNLAEAGYNVSKYLVYGPVREVLPYLVRRAQENTSVTGEMGRELKLVQTELARRVALK
ncbi:hypothetical protein A3850_013310 [Lewinella sp. 4G2]|nr:hypothetical protein A3850_013310 [Lewinella sp. 4G2]